MIISPDTQAVLDFLDEYYKRSMRKLNDIGVILELGARNNSAEDINRLIFAGKSVWNLYRKAKSVTMQPNPIEEEMERNISEMQKYLTAIKVENADEEIGKRFSDVYLNDKFETKFNLIDLAHDLALIKELQTKNREGSLFDPSEPKQ